MQLRAKVLYEKMAKQKKWPWASIDLAYDHYHSNQRSSKPNPNKVRFMSKEEFANIFRLLAERKHSRLGVVKELVPRETPIYAEGMKNRKFTREYSTMYNRVKRIGQFFGITPGNSHAKNTSSGKRKALEREFPGLNTQINALLKSGTSIDRIAEKLGIDRRRIMLFARQKYNHTGLMQFQRRVNSKLRAHPLRDDFRHLLSIKEISPNGVERFAFSAKQIAEAFNQVAGRKVVDNSSVLRSNTTPSVIRTKEDMARVLKKNRNKTPIEKKRASERLFLEVSQILARKEAEYANYLRNLSAQKKLVLENTLIEKSMRFNPNKSYSTSVTSGQQELKVKAAQRKQVLVQVFSSPDFIVYKNILFHTLISTNRELLLTLYDLGEKGLNFIRVKNDAISLNPNVIRYLGKRNENSTFFFLD